MMDLKDLRKLDSDDLLKLIGLSKRREAADWLVPALGFLGAGIIIGAGVGLLFAPKSGREIREDLRNRLEAAPEAVRSNLSGISGTTTEKSPPRL